MLMKSYEIICSKTCTKIFNLSVYSVPSNSFTIWRRIRTSRKFMHGLLIEAFVSISEQKSILRWQFMKMPKYQKFPQDTKSRYQQKIVYSWVKRWPHLSASKSHNLLKPKKLLYNQNPIANSFLFLQMDLLMP